MKDKDISTVQEVFEAMQIQQFGEKQLSIMRQRISNYDESDAHAGIRLQYIRLRPHIRVMQVISKMANQRRDMKIRGIMLKGIRLR